MRMNCELSLCGNVLGKGGQKIRKMNKDSGAHISLSEYIKGATHRTAKITGNVEAVSSAIFLVATALNEPKIVGDTVPNSEPPAYLNLVLVVPKKHAGSIIGKGGQRVKDMRVRYSDCKIVLSDKFSEGPDDTITVSGPTEKVREIIYEVNKTIMDQFAPKGDYTLPPECNQSAGRGHSQSSYGTPYTGMYPTETGYGGGGGGGRGMGMSASGPTMFLDPSVGMHGNMKLQAEYHSQDVGAIIGRGGERVKRLRMETGVAVKVDNTTTGEVTRLATFTGTPKGIAATLHYIAYAIGVGRPHRGQGPLNVMLRMDPREIGGVIGKRGAKINIMRDESGARIEIDPKGGISIEGYSPNLAAGLQMVVMQMFQQREKFGGPSNPQVPHEALSGNGTT
ncbi:hypothetical protein AAMO2058_000524200 [Amorphochlora amoebiformis]